jgi:4-hydroxy-tetrahydrodipicolinate reductase
VLQRLVSEAVATLDDYDLELMETHHNGKVDAPSGTANTLLETVQEERDVEPVYGREGHAPREDDEIGVFARRAGDIRGEHELILAGNDEVLSLSHRAEDRGVFAAGALDAAGWLDGRDAGWYSFGEVVDA